MSAIDEIINKIKRLHLSVIKSNHNMVLSKYESNGIHSKSSRIYQKNNYFVKHSIPFPKEYVVVGAHDDFSQSSRWTCWACRACMPAEVVLRHQPRGLIDLDQAHQVDEGLTTLKLPSVAFQSWKKSERALKNIPSFRRKHVPLCLFRVRHFQITKKNQSVNSHHLYKDQGKSKLTWKEIDWLTFSFIGL